MSTPGVGKSAAAIGPKGYLVTSSSLPCFFQGRLIIRDSETKKVSTFTVTPFTARDRRDLTQFFIDFLGNSKDPVPVTVQTMAQQRVDQLISGYSIHAQKGTAAPGSLIGVCILESDPEILGDLTLNLSMEEGYQTQSIITGIFEWVKSHFLPQMRAWKIAIPAYGEGGKKIGSNALEYAKVRTVTFASQRIVNEALKAVGFRLVNTFPDPPLPENPPEKTTEDPSEKKEDPPDPINFYELPAVQDPIPTEEKQRPN